MLAAPRVCLTVDAPLFPSRPAPFLSLQAKKNALTEGHVTHFLYDAADVVAHVHRCSAVAAGDAQDWPAAVLCGM